MRILVADGDPQLLRLMQVFLRGNGHEPETASDGLGTVQLLREFQPDVVILERDLLWGGSDGVRALMREDADLTQIPLILMAADLPAGDGPAARAGRSTGNGHSVPADLPPIAGWLRKPLRLSDLAHQLDTVGAQLERAAVANEWPQPDLEPFGVFPAPEGGSPQPLAEEGITPLRPAVVPLP
ncbi:MAG: PleD family two-component system response regulator [Planctomycetaceae bacterium]